MKNLIKEFKTFISRGNVIELAVALIMATYFGAIVKSFVDDIIMPPLGYIIAGIDFADLRIKLGERMMPDGTIQNITLNYGNFINHILTFLIVSFAIFLVVKMYNNFMKKKEAEPAKPPAPNNQEKLLMEIRDLLKEKNQKE